jgi:3-hydroxyanthranilate 3,4-dioxygenase
MLSTPLTPFELSRFIDAHREEWARERMVRRIIWENSEYLTFLNRGPTPDPQYHIGPCDELFVQQEGELHLHYLEGSERKLVVLRPGQMLFLPQGVPHSPRRPEGSWTVVVERKRQPGQVDRFIWICAECSRQLDVIEAGGGPTDTRASDVPPFVSEVNQRLRALGSCPECGAPVPV